MTILLLFINPSNSSILSELHRRTRLWRSDNDTSAEPIQEERPTL
jgi:hypothetical protein